MASEKDNPGVIAPPPLIFLGGLIINGLLNWFYPLPFLPPFLRIVWSATLIAAGIGIILAAVIKMRRHATNVEPWKPTTAIVGTGVYAFSRNPIYLGMSLIYAGAGGGLFNSWWFAPLLGLVLTAIYFGVIVREEKYLTGKFGDDYTSYKNRVRRWI